MRPLFSSLKEHLTQLHILVSTVAGLTFRDMLAMFDEYGIENSQLVRAAPSIAASVRESATLYVSYQDRDFPDVVRLFRLLGPIITVGEEQLDAGGAICGCGLVFAVKYLRAVQLAGVEAGLEPSTALQLAEQTLIGATKLLQEGGRHPEAEVDQMVTPGGAAARGVCALEQSGFSGAVIAGFRRCLE